MQIVEQIGIWVMLTGFRMVVLVIQGKISDNQGVKELLFFPSLPLDVVSLM